MIDRGGALTRRGAALAALALPALLAIPAPARAAPASYVLDPQHSWVHFEVLHFGTSTIRGRFGPVQGEVLLDRAAGRGEVALRIPTASVDTGLKFFDERLRRDDLLASAAHPEVFFVARQFRFEGGGVAEVRGEFTWRGVSQPLSLRAERFACRQEASPARETCGGDFTAELLRSEFGASFGLPFVGDRVQLRVQVEGQRR